MTDRDPVPAAMQEAQWLNGDHLGLDPLPVEPVANAMPEVNPENSKAPAMSLEAEQREPNDLEAMPTLDPCLIRPDGEDGGPTNPDDPKIVTIQTTIEDLPETLPPKQIDKPPELTVNKITWPLIGRVTDPGRYMFRFGWLTVTAADLAIWKAYPNAAFTLIRSSTPPPAGTDEELAGEEFRLGTFELRTDSNYWCCSLNKVTSVVFDSGPVDDQGTMVRIFAPGTWNASASRHTDGHK